MGFHEVQFPPTLSRQATSGPATSTNIIETDSGGEQRVPRWSGARWRGDARKGLRNNDDIRTCLNFYRARLGPAHGFRFKDWFDYATNPTGTLHLAADVAVTKDDQLLGTGDGSRTTFQLLKRYISGPTTIVRNITKPVSGTVKIALDGTLKTEGVDYTINYATGVVTMTAAPTTGVSVTGGCQFDVPVRFAKEIDASGLLASLDGHGQASLGSVPLIEIIDGLELPEDRPPGGGSSFTMSANVSITMQDGFAISVDPQSAGLIVIIPDEQTALTNLAFGGPYWSIFNRHGSNSVAVREGAAGGRLVGTIAAGTGKIIVLGHDASGNKTWYAL